MSRLMRYKEGQTGEKKESSHDPGLKGLKYPKSVCEGRFKLLKRHVM